MVRGVLGSFISSIFSASCDGSDLLAHAPIPGSQEFFMSLVSSQPSPGVRNHAWNPEEKPSLTKHLRGISEFLRGLRVQLRFGELTRAPLLMLRFQLVGEFAECDWLARAPDPWDVDLSQSTRQHHAALQTLKDAIDVRAMLFAVLPRVESAHLRIFRESAEISRELIVAGYAHRNDQSSRSVHSLAMRARVLGFRFSIEDGSLCEISEGRSHGSGPYNGLAIKSRNDDRNDDLNDDLNDDFDRSGRW
jgi:hypothetical protein